MLRWVLGAVVCVIVGVMLLNRYFAGVPALERLTRVEGEVTSAEVVTQRTRRMNSEILSVRVGDNPPAFYPQRLPEFDRLSEALRPGEKVTAWVDVGGNNYIWQLERGGDRLVSYDQVAEAQRSNDSGNAMLGGLFLAVGFGIPVGGVRATIGPRTGKGHATTISRGGVAPGAGSIYPHVLTGRVSGESIPPLYRE